MNAAATLVPPCTVVCVVLNWNGWRDTIPCVESLLSQNQRQARLQVVVVDNASTDDSVARIRAAFPSVELLLAEANRGFAAGCNLGMRLALERKADFVWLLNNDTTAPADTLTKLTEAAMGTRAGGVGGIGIVGTVLRYMDEPARIQAWGGGLLHRFSGYSRHFYAPTELGPSSFLTFASVLLRCSMLQSIGLLDEGFFMYFEDSDLCFRARHAGWRLVVAEDTAVLHREGGTTGKRSPRSDRIVVASGLRFLCRHGRPRSLAAAVFLALRLGSRAVRGDVAGIRATLSGVGDWRRQQPGAPEEDSTPQQKQAHS